MYSVALVFEIFTKKKKLLLYIEFGLYMMLYMYIWPFIWINYYENKYIMDELMLKNIFPHEL